MDIEKVIGELKFSLDHVNSEDELLSSITGGLTALRQLYRSCRDPFTPDRVKFLQSLTPVSDRLRTFIELREELPGVRSAEDYSAKMSQLVDIKDMVAHLAVRKRVMKEIRELTERLPSIHEQSELSRQGRITVCIAELERESSTQCRRNHAMAIRDGPDGYFWGCGEFPACWESAQLTPKQKDRLRSCGG